MICVHCQEEIYSLEDRADVLTMDVHKECMVRSVVGGIGHLLDHSHFCSGPLGPDAGLDYRTSSLMVDVWVHRKGINNV